MSSQIRHLAGIWRQNGRFPRRFGALAGTHPRVGRDLVETAAQAGASQEESRERAAETVHAPSPDAPRTLHHGSTAILGEPLGLALQITADHQILWFEA